MLKVASTREIIEKLQKYEDRNGIGAIVGLSTFCGRDRTSEYEFTIANDSEDNRVSDNEDKHYKRTTIKISSIYDAVLFSQKSEYTFNCEFIDDDEKILSVLVYENNGKKYEVWIDMFEEPETMYYKNGNKPVDKDFQDILVEHLMDNFPDYFPPAVLESRYA